MSSIEKPKHPKGHPDREIECQSAIEVEFLRLIYDAKLEGWEADEVAMALMEIAADYVGGNDADLDDDAEFEPMLIDRKD